MQVFWQRAIKALTHSIEMKTCKLKGYYSGNISKKTRGTVVSDTAATAP